MNAAIRLEHLSPLELDILSALEKFGPTKAFLFEESVLDHLFKRRPRLICLVRGYDDAVIDITAEGRLEANRARS